MPFDKEAMGHAIDAIERWDEGKEPFTKAAVASVLRSLLPVALRETPAQWRPIETAPKDGTQILLWIVGIDPRPRIGFWCERENGAGWYGLQTQHFIAVNVTHWMPLPVAPPALEPSPETTEPTI